MKRSEKESFVLRVKDELQKASTVIAVNRSYGITVDEITKLRKSMHEEGANLRVLKNTLARIAIKDSHLDVLKDMFSGPTAVAYSDNPVGMAKALAEFVKTNDKMSILGGVMDGAFITESQINALATIPSMDELKSKIVGLFNAVATKLARTVKEPGAKIVRVIAAKQ